MKVLLTGGARYVGSHTARELARRGHTVRIYDNLSTGHRRLAQGHDLVVGDLRDSGKLASALAGVDAVLHFAAHAYVGESFRNPRKYFDNNVVAGINLLNGVLDAGVRTLIFSSTCSIYGVPARQPITEDTPPQPVNPYGASKLFFEHALRGYSDAYGLRYASLRYFNAAGADESGEIGELHDPETHLIPSALLVAAGRRPELEIFGTDYPTPDGTCIRDYIHVTDLGVAHSLALEHLATGGESLALNLGTGTGHSVKEVNAMVESVTGRKLRVKMQPRRPGDPPILVASPARAEKVLSWKATRTLETIVSSAWEWLQKN